MNVPSGCLVSRVQRKPVAAIGDLPGPLLAHTAFCSRGRLDVAPQLTDPAEIACLFTTSLVIYLANLSRASPFMIEGTSAGIEICA
jgi:hypothetical protein